MDLDDIPIIRHLGALGTILKVVMLLAGFVIFPLLILNYYVRARDSPYVNERRFFQFRMLGVIFVFNAFVMVMQSAFYRMFNHFFVDPSYGQWLFVSWIFTSKHGQDLFFNELILMLILSPLCFFVAWLIGSLNFTNEFIPRFYRRMY